MRRGTALVALLSLSWTAQAMHNYSSIDMMRAQMSLMDNRPDDCPPWYVTRHGQEIQVLTEAVSIVFYLPSPADNIPSVTNSMGNATVPRDMVGMIA
jgi:hypothetical protein